MAQRIYFDPSEVLKIPASFASVSVDELVSIIIEWWAIHLWSLCKSARGS